LADFEGGSGILAGGGVGCRLPWAGVGRRRESSFLSSALACGRIFGRFSFKGDRSKFGINTSFCWC